LGFRHLILTDDLEMGAILRHCPIEDATRAAFAAGEDMVLICSSTEAVRKGYRAMLEAFRRGEFTEDRIEESLLRITEIKSILREPLSFDAARLEELSREIGKLNEKLNYSYGGRI
jgi:beta-N-acetylhexosaminidase